MQEPQYLELFGSTHLWIMGLLIIIAFIMIAPVRRWGNDDQKKQLAIGLGAVMIVMEVLDRGYQIIVLDELIKDNLPFHLCGIGVFLGAVLLIFRNFRLFEIMYFWGLVGAIQAIVTPDLEINQHTFLFVTYFLSHWMIIVAVLYRIFVYSYRPTWKSLWRAFLWLNAYTLLVAPINLLFDTNYLFICEKPGSASLLDIMGPWPWYILALEGVALLLFAVFYSPYALRDIFHRMRS